MNEVQEPIALIDPPALVTDILKELRALAIDHENHLVMNITGAVPKQLWLGHPKTFVRVMYNLIGNAIKFTHQGNVTISLTFTPDLPRGATLLVDVTDTGVGIAAEDCKQIFEPFFTATENRADGAKNHTGLGLAIAKMGTEKMSGRLNVSSKMGHGSSFFFEIPLMAAPASNTQEPTLAPFDTDHQFDMACLVVDDNQVNLDLTAQMLRKIGCKVLIAGNGGEAIKLCRDNDFDVVFMDLNMPGGLSGTEATHVIRSSGNCSGATIIALTADTTFQGPDVLAAAKFDLVLHKPVDVDDLVSTLNKVNLRRKAGATNDQSKGPTTPFKPSEKGRFDQLFELVGEAHALKLLAGVQDDINAVTKAIVQLGPNAADQLHRAIGSTAAIGLVQLSKSLRETEDLVRNGELNQPSQQFASLHKHIADAQRELTRALK
jgi:CheY-like chemotaxis protein